MGGWLAAVGGDDCLDALDVGRRAAVGRDCPSARRHPGRPDEVLKTTRGEDEKHPASLVSHFESVRQPSRTKRVVADSSLKLGAAHLERDLAVEDPEALVLAVVHMQRRLVTGPACDLHDRAQATGISSSGLDLCERSEPPSGDRKSVV